MARHHPRLHLTPTPLPTPTPQPLMEGLFYFKVVRRILKRFRVLSRNFHRAPVEVLRILKKCRGQQQVVGAVAVGPLRGARVTRVGTTK
ncbi:hypothetical protein E2C01_008751 [Portunus trituberculatus]|uniref:Uncharacterized protein n=1 Tax=Portunus trituberculatus TaxID=210409 RepID=A0A5B7D521_PORTR|nr:hypothetical protein [Portunus trituberculatus]